jgi:hypothetical protein
VRAIVDYRILLLSHISPLFRCRVLKELLGCDSQDEELKENIILGREDPILMNLISLQNKDGSWNRLSQANALPFDSFIATGQALRLLNFLGFDKDYEPAARGVQYLFSHQDRDGSWPMKQVVNEEGGQGYTSVSLQTSLPLQGLAAIGLSCDERCIRAYQWLLDQRLDDGAWPTGRSGKVLGFVAGYRRLAHSRWGCRSNTTAAALCLSLHGDLRTSAEAARALDHLLGRETREETFLGHDMARLLGEKPLKGFFTFYAPHDLLLILRLCADLGADRTDPRVESLVDFFEKREIQRGHWESSTGDSAWFSLEVSLAIEKIKQNTGWAPGLPQTPFTPYKKEKHRY